MSPQFTGANANQRAEKYAKLVSTLGGKCSGCGTTDDTYYQFHFHHTDPSTKSFNVGGSLTLRYSLLLEEAKKCHLLCRDCHFNYYSTHHDVEEHGYNAYASGRCDCDICHQAYKDYWTKINRARGRKEKTIAQHGTRSKYVSGCRCTDCREANRNYNQWRKQH